MFKRIAKKFSRRSEAREISSEAKEISSEELLPLIEKKAYEFYEERGCVHGDDMNDWFEAEKAVLGDLDK